MWFYIFMYLLWLLLNYSFFLSFIKGNFVFLTKTESVYLSSYNFNMILYFYVIRVVKSWSQAVKENIVLQITNATQMVKLEKDPHAAFALIIDGKMLTYALEEDLKHQFLNLAVDCASVICCRVSPKQKAMVSSLNKSQN